mmetsp:Transcript_5545/g.9475  ORF Transcript_5545/g.9475 Transcript_5545/m.9475 type:complete len:249 (-) Transcript_5545:30-776(-)
MIQETINRTRALNIPVGFYHSGRHQPTPFISTRTGLRLINVNKLIEVGYTSVPIGMDKQQFIKKHSLPKKESIKLVGTLRLMEKGDVKEVFRLFKEQCSKHKIHVVFDEAQCGQMFLPIKEVVSTYVVEDPEQKGKLTDFMSFTYFHQICLEREKKGHNHEFEVDATFSYCAFTRNNYEDMIKQAMWIAKDEMKCDALAIEGIMDHDIEVLEQDFKFLLDDGKLNYFFLNFSLGELQPASSDFACLFI